MQLIARRVETATTLTSLTEIVHVANQTIDWTRQDIVKNARFWVVRLVIQEHVYLVRMMERFSIMEPANVQILRQWVGLGIVIAIINPLIFWTVNVSVYLVGRNQMGDVSKYVKMKTVSIVIHRKNTIVILVIILLLSPAITPAIVLLGQDFFLDIAKYVTAHAKAV